MALTDSELIACQWQGCGNKATILCDGPLPGESSWACDEHKQGYGVVPKKRKVNREQILRWLREGVFRITSDGRVFKDDRELAVRPNRRKRSAVGDPRVDLCHEACQYSINISHLIWMLNADTVIPEGFEIHHLDENPDHNEFTNLICVHALDHLKLHGDDEVPF